MRVGLDYFGIDCHVAPTGDVLVFEANATMNYLPYNSEPEYLYIREMLADITRDAVGRLLEAKLGQPLPPLASLELEPSSLAAAAPRAGESPSA